MVRRRRFETPESNMEMMDYKTCTECARATIETHVTIVKGSFCHNYDNRKKLAKKRSSNDSESRDTFRPF
jgi:hypothetical protein